DRFKFGNRFIEGRPVDQFGEFSQFVCWDAKALGFIVDLTLEFFWIQANSILLHFVLKRLQCDLTDSFL
ncbi:MAG: hypothetical protein Q8Q03_02930, partial [bacterium]|nr:hypothetical protein [bacterium]